MGIESDHLVYEYLSRVGDLAQRRQLSSGDRMRLVSGLRDEIDRRRAKYEPETPAAVRRILERIGTPEEVLDTLSPQPPRWSPAAADPGPAVPAQREPGRLRRRQVPPPRPERAPEPAPPHLAGLDELGAGEKMEPDWWRMAPGAAGSSGSPGSSVEGFAGGIEIPDLFKEPEPDESAGGPDPAPSQAPERPTLVRFLRERRRAAKADAAAVADPPAAARPKPHLFLLLAALVLAAGAVSGHWLLLAAGWLLAYASRVLGPTERKLVVFGLPGAVFATAVVWVWGRLEGKWGAPLADGAMGGTFHDMWPWLVRGAAVASALYLVWRSRRRA
ncbi:hypothetical protein [Streptomyces sp. NBC_00503]|uniref:hypothetical protein n=1 Tax=Streptomyces sp. NBC_00503 TaxID=2903659 RepID=UPI002E81513B|nr:hypothetical protein [Streptomyces sp. NBC_00503]WUD82060.1 hypothetical protein OG490_16750 [Streptomyces sp. NBC_00503]